jgi:hypothetical protein
MSGYFYFGFLRGNRGAVKKIKKIFDTVSPMNYFGMDNGRGVAGYFDFAQ